MSLVLAIEIVPHSQYSNIGHESKTNIEPKKENCNQKLKTPT